MFKYGEDKSVFGEHIANERMVIMKPRQLSPLDNRQRGLALFGVAALVAAFALLACRLILRSEIDRPDSLLMLLPAWGGPLLLAWAVHGREKWNGSALVHGHRSSVGQLAQEPRRHVFQGVGFWVAVGGGVWLALNCIPFDDPDDQLGLWVGPFAIPLVALVMFAIAVVLLIALAVSAGEGAVSFVAEAAPAVVDEPVGLIIVAVWLVGALIAVGLFFKAERFFSKKAKAKKAEAREA